MDPNTQETNPVPEPQQPVTFQAPPVPASSQPQVIQPQSFQSTEQPTVEPSLPPAPPQTPISSSTSSSKKHSKNKMLVTVILALLLIVGAGAAYWVKKPKSTPSTTKPTANSETAPINTSAVSIKATGFEPAVLKIKAGDQVVWTNDDTAQHRISADPYPSKSSLPELDSSQPLNKNETFGFTFNTKGTITYNDYLNPSKFTGTIIVE